MNFRILIVVSLFVLTGCGQRDSDTVEQAADTAPAAEAIQAPDREVQAPDREVQVTDPEVQVTDAEVQVPPIEITEGISMRILKEGKGDPAEIGQIAVVHYTGWLYDQTAENNRGDKFDSSVDRDQYFSFMLGAGRVIKGWDQGVVGMKVGETRELTIPPEMGYGDRGAGAVIPPGATLVFEIELAELQGSE